MQQTTININNFVSLFKLIESVQKHISHCRALHSYPKSAESFFLLCQQVADDSLLWLKKAIESPTENKYLQLSTHLMTTWDLLHAFIKPVVDANTLIVPHPFTRFLNDHIRRLRKTDDVPKTEIVIEIIPQLNYMQHGHGRLIKLLKNLKFLGISPNPHKAEKHALCGLTKGKQVFP